MEYFDTHAHYDDEKFESDREEVLKKIYNAGVTKCINMGCDVESSKKAIAIADNHEFIYAGVGLHPEEIPQTEEELWKTIAQIKEFAIQNLNITEEKAKNEIIEYEQSNNEMTIINRRDDKIINNEKSNNNRVAYKTTNCKKVVAIGEIGLDYYWRQDNKELQKQAFIKQIEIANELKLPVSIHTRDAIDDMIAIIRKYKLEQSGVLHCCPFNRELVKHALENGLYIGFGGTSTFKSSKNAKEIVNMVPNDKILIETDSPYLSPEPKRGTRNDSSNLKYVVERLAEYKEIEPEQIAKITYENANRLFKI